MVQRRRRSRGRRRSSQRDPRRQGECAGGRGRRRPWRCAAVESGRIPSIQIERSSISTSLPTSASTHVRLMSKLIIAGHLNAIAAPPPADQISRLAPCPASFLSFLFSLSASWSYLTPRSLSHECHGAPQQTLAVAAARPASPSTSPLVPVVPQVPVSRARPRASSSAPRRPPLNQQMSAVALSLVPPSSRGFLCLSSILSLLCTGAPRAMEATAGLHVELRRPWIFSPRGAT